MSILVIEGTEQWAVTWYAVSSQKEKPYTSLPARLTMPMPSPLEPGASLEICASPRLYGVR